MKSFRELMSESFTTKVLNVWKKNAEARGLRIRKGVHPTGEMDPYYTATDKHGNKRGYYDTISGKGVLEESVLSEAKKLACLGCDEVSTEQAWKKNSGTCPKCKKSTKGVAESLELQESFKKGAKVKIKNVKSYDALAKSDSGVVIGMKDKDTVMIQVGKGQINADVKDVILESEQLDETLNPYFRLPGNVINNELYQVKGMLDVFYSTQKNGDDFNEKNFNNIIRIMQDIKKAAKKFKAGETPPLPYRYKDK